MRSCLNLMLCLCLPILAASCTQTSAPDEKAAIAVSSDVCCASIERYPRWLVRVADPAAPVIGSAIAAVNWRHGLLARYPAAQADLVRHLRPLDILVTGHEGRLSNRLIPGHFTHALTYLGNERELRLERQA